MAAVPAYSIFSASSELLVTAAVFYVLWRAYARDDLRIGLLAVVLAFEAVVNIAYMAYRMAVPSEGLAGAPHWVTVTAALHGLLSLAMFLFLLLLAAMAYGEHKKGGNLFREQPGLMWSFAALWSLSVLSGEAIFVFAYLV
ncbi:MAG TPA: hypothetical protein VI796_02580 [Candidatus Thermoplasmatota archaeon]|nr:hypothetical protein [Candidatus Thermoplasmatota archaeon]